MSTTTEVTPNLPRPSRGSSSGTSRPRGTRRGGATRGGLTKSSPPEQSSSDWAATLEDQDSSEEVAQLKSKYANQLKSLREIFPDWTADDLVYALQEVDGDLALATDRIAGGILSLASSILKLGHATQWGQVKKKGTKDKAKPSSWTETAPTATRGRGRGGAERGADRGPRGRGGIPTPQIRIFNF